MYEQITNWWSYLQKKRGKNASIFINLIPPDSSENDGLDSVERVHKSPESPKTIEKLESFTDNDLGYIQNVTPSMHLINTPLSSAMGIREKMRRQFYFDFYCRKSQIWRHYDGKNFGQNFVISGGVSTIQQCIINNISKNKH